MAKSYCEIAIGPTDLSFRPPPESRLRSGGSERMAITLQELLNAPDLSQHTNQPVQLT